MWLSKCPPSAKISEQCPPGLESHWLELTQTAGSWNLLGKAQPMLIAVTSPPGVLEENR